MRNLLLCSWEPKLGVAFLEGNFTLLEFKMYNPFDLAILPSRFCPTDKLIQMWKYTCTGHFQNNCLSLQ